MPDPITKHDVFCAVCGHESLDHIQIAGFIGSKHDKCHCSGLRLVTQDQLCDCDRFVPACKECGDA